MRLWFGCGAVQAVPVLGSGGSSGGRALSVFQYSFVEKDGSGSGFGSWKTVPTPLVPGKTVPTVPLSGSGSGSVLEPSWKQQICRGATTDLIRSGKLTRSS